MTDFWSICFMVIWKIIIACVFHFVASTFIGIFILFKAVWVVHALCVKSDHIHQLSWKVSCHKPYSDSVNIDDWRTFSYCFLTFLISLVVTSPFPKFSVQSNIDVQSCCEHILFQFCSLIGKLLKLFIPN